MKKRILIIGLLLLFSTAISTKSVAQNSSQPNESESDYNQQDTTSKSTLAIFKFFEQLKNNKGALYVELTPDPKTNNILVNDFEMQVFKSLIYKNTPESYSLLMECLDADKSDFKKVKETMSDGKIISAYYQLPQIEEDINRFILFKTSGENYDKCTLVYMEGELDSDDLVSLLFQFGFPSTNNH